MNKLSIVGAGIVGEATAQIIARDEFCRELMLIDVQGDLAKGKALDLEQSSTCSGADAKVTGTSNWEDLAGSDVLIITAGIPRKPGQSRDDLVGVNLPIIQNVADNAKKYCPDAFVILEDGIAYVRDASGVHHDPGGPSDLAVVEPGNEDRVIAAALDCPGECIFVESGH